MPTDLALHHDVGALHPRCRAGSSRTRLPSSRRQFEPGNRADTASPGGRISTMPRQDLFERQLRAGSAVRRPDTDSSVPSPAPATLQDGRQLEVSSRLHAASRSTASGAPGPPRVALRPSTRTKSGAAGRTWRTQFGFAHNRLPVQPFPVYGERPIVSHHEVARAEAREIVEEVRPLAQFHVHRRQRRLHDCLRSGDLAPVHRNPQRRMRTAPAAKSDQQVGPLSRRSVCG